MIGFVFLGVAILFLIFQLSKAGIGESFELVNVDDFTITYIVHAKNREPRTKRISRTCCYPSMSTREMEWTTNQNIAARGHSE